MARPGKENSFAFGGDEGEGGDEEVDGSENAGPQWPQGEHVKMYIYMYIHVRAYVPSSAPW